MIRIKLGDDISAFHSDPMTQTIEVEYFGDDYDNTNATGLALEQLHKDLARLDFPYFFVKIITTNLDIERELSILHKIYSDEPEPLEYKIIEGIYDKRVYYGDTYCILPWIHKYVNPQGLVLPCCEGNEDYPLGSIKNNSLDEISTEHVRELMQAGQRPSECTNCWRKEDLGLTSQRQKNSVFSQYRNQTEFVLRHLDIRLSNKCNLMCRMCSGKFSNRIAQEENKLYGFTKYKDEILRDDLVEKQLDFIRKNVHTIDTVYFAGGEPLINEEHYEILNILIDADKTDVKISYNTNFSMLKFKKHSILDYWKHFDTIEIGASIDLIGNQSDYVRHGVEYNRLEENYNVVKDLPNIHFTITSILHLMNIFNLPRLQKNWIEKGLLCKDIKFNCLSSPEEQAITVLPEHYKNLALVNIDSHIEYLKTVKDSEDLIRSWQEAREFMTSKNDTYLLGEFFRLNDDKDKNRNQVFEDYFPEYKDLRNYA